MVTIGGIGTPSSYLPSSSCSSDISPGKTDASGVRLLLSEVLRVSRLFFPFLALSSSFFNARSFLLASFIVCNPASSHLTEHPPEEPPEDTEMGLTLLVLLAVLVEAGLAPARMPHPNTAAGSADSLSEVCIREPTTDDAVDPLRIDGRRIVEGRPRPRIDFFFLRDSLVAFLSGLAVSAPASKLLPE